MAASGLQAYARETYGVEMSVEEVELFKKRFFSAYRGVDAWHKGIQRNKPSESRTLARRKYIYGRDSGMSGRCSTHLWVQRRIF